MIKYDIDSNACCDKHNDKWDMRIYVSNSILRQNTEYGENYYDNFCTCSLKIRELMNGLEGEGIEYLNACIESCKRNESAIQEIINERISFVETQIARKREEEEDEKAFEVRWTVKRSHFNGRYRKFVRTVDDLKAETWCEYGNRLIFVEEDADYDYNYYSKSYGHPKKTVNGRRVVIKKLSRRGRTKGCVVVDKEYEIDSFRQTNILGVIASHFGLEKPNKNKLQTSPFYEVKKVKKGLYKQLFGKQIVGYVAVDDATGMVCHGSTEETALKGLIRKNESFKRENERVNRKTLTAEYLHEEFGFCAQGMREFAESAGIDVNGQYSINELRAAAKKANRDVVRKYSSELRKIDVI